MATDAELIMKIRSGEREVYADLYHKYHRQIHAFCLCILKNQYDADDTTQDAFIHAYLKLDQLQKPARFFSWLKRIAQNLATDQIRQKHIMPVPLGSVYSEAGSDIPDGQILRQELMDAIMDAIELLPMEDRDVIRARMDGLNHREISERFGISVPASVSRIYRARKKLVSSMKEFLYIAFFLPRKLFVGRTIPDGITSTGAGSSLVSPFLGSLAIHSILFVVLSICSLSMPIVEEKAISTDPILTDIVAMKSSYGRIVLPIQAQAHYTHKPPGVIPRPVPRIAHSIPHPIKEVISIIGLSETSKPALSKPSIASSVTKHGHVIQTLWQQREYPPYIKEQKTQDLGQSAKTNVIDETRDFKDILPNLANSILARSNRKRIDVILVLDVTGSMISEIRQLKASIGDFLHPMADEENDCAIGLVLFGDQDGALPQIISLTEKLDRPKEWLNRIELLYGGDPPESGYEALITALGKIHFRESAQKFFVFISDDVQHDSTYDGKSAYSLGETIAALNDKHVSVDVVGVDSPYMKRLARETGGRWEQIPGHFPALSVQASPVTVIPVRRIGMAVKPGSIANLVTIEFRNSEPKWIALSYEVYSQRVKVTRGILFQGKPEAGTDRTIHLPLEIDLDKSMYVPGDYRLVYRLEDSLGNTYIFSQFFVLDEVGS